METAGSTSQSISVLVVDNQLAVRTGIIELLAAQPDMIVAGEADNGLEALAQAKAVKPDLILMDVGMPACNGIEATYLILHELPQVKIVILAESDDDQYLFQAIEAGAQGYLLKDLEPEALLKMVRGVFKGEAPISRSAAGRILREFSRRANSEADITN